MYSKVYKNIQFLIHLVILGVRNYLQMTNFQFKLIKCHRKKNLGLSKKTNFYFNYENDRKLIQELQLDMGCNKYF